MRAAEVLAEARRAGVRLRLAEDGRLRVTGRPEDVPAALLAALREHKAGLAELPGADPFGPRTHHPSEGQPPRRSPPAQARYRM